MKSFRASMQLKERREKAIPRAPFHVTPLSANRAKGALIWDVDGNEYIDFAGGIGAVNAGHSPDSVVKAIKEQSEQFLHTCFNVLMYEPYIQLAETLNRITPGNFTKKTMFFNSGAEAVENAVKIARVATGRKAVVCFEHAFHGRTLLTMSLTAKEKPYKQGFGPFADGIYRAEYPYPYRLPEVFTDMENPQTYYRYFEYFFKTQVPAKEIAAIIVEPVLGEGGFIVPPNAFLPSLKKICEDNGIVFIADEIQSGFCRTGKMFAVEHYGIGPDLITMGKSIASGLPLSAVCGRDDLMDAPQVGGLGGTYSGNPLACSAALATIELYQSQKLCIRAEMIGKRLIEFWDNKQKQYDFIGDVRGLGAMVGVEFVKDLRTKQPYPELVSKIIQKCYQKGLIIMSAGTYGNVLRSLMPLVITDQQMDDALKILDETLGEIITDLP